MVYEFTLLSFVVEGRVIVCSVSMVLRLEILVDIPCLAGSVVVVKASRPQCWFQQLMTTYYYHD
jgi:hypothetical protein